MYCPKCKTEYIPGITVCADCGTPLVEELTEEVAPRECFEEVELADCSMDEIDEVVKGMCLEEMSQAQKKNKEDIVYTSASFKAKDNLSSAITFLGFGICGLLLSILSKAGVINFALLGEGWFGFTVMTTLFALMLIYGIITLMKYKGMAKEADAEEQMLSDISLWQKENITEDVLLQASAGAENEEEAELLRMEIVRQLTREHFPLLPAAMLEHLTDTFFADSEKSPRESEDA